jgi:hypothetical protein
VLRGVGFVLAVGLVGTLGLTGVWDSVAQRTLGHLPLSAPAPAPSATPDPEPAEIPGSSFRLRDLPSHPDVMHQPYLGFSMGVSADTSSLLYKFRDLLDLYRKRQGVDDNFTMRVLDNRSGELLEVYTLTDERRAYRRSGGPVDWRAIDRERRRATRRLVDKYEARGYPTDAITVKWGRANQVHEAHRQEEPYIEYEIRLARYLGLSLLPIEIGMVETFNQDHLVSSVGARSRYQMMPFILRRNGLHRYHLPTAPGGHIQVQEELHPLLTMKPAFLLLKGYVNAVGHEIPGISAYHTGPGNIYKLYRLFFTESGKYFDASASVMDAYMWAVTEGFETVRERSTFGPYSRGYVASAYGALQAIDDERIDTTKTMRAVRVRVADGKDVTLDRLLEALRGRALNWHMDGVRTEPDTPYNRFRALNPHLDLPPPSGEGVPPRGNVRFVSAVSGQPVRFFLPLGGPAALRASGIDVLDSSAQKVFDTGTFAPPAPSEVTVWDRRYEALVRDIRHFGFTQANRARLLRLYDKFEALAEENPSSYRQAQLHIIRTHRRIWLSNPWDKLSAASALAMGTTKMPASPPYTQPTSPAPDLPANTPVDDAS